jgi:ATP-binding cassette subfamily A (ABC1) protein 3
MLKNYKNGRIILLTTHFMDEADYLGDRIAIMGNGRLLALGSNVFLKNKFGLGYNLTFVKKDISVKSEPILECVKKHIPAAKILTNVSAEFSVQLPMDEVHRFGALFNYISSQQESLGI